MRATPRPFRAPARKLRCGLLLAGLIGLSPWAAAQLLEPLPGD